MLRLITLAASGPIASLFWQNEDYGVGIGSEIYLDGVICVVDAVFGEKVCESNCDHYTRSPQSPSAITGR